jgi:predicted ATPase
MTISKLKIKNFKGVNELAEFDIKQITLFIGPNSSGKSSCIHALAALAQTSKLPSSSRPLVLDDEYAQVHLGRFIEVIHSKSYSDAIEIGFESTNIKYSFRGIGKIQKLASTDIFSANYSFKSTKRTQDIYLNTLTYSSPASNLNFKPNKTIGTYTIEFNNKIIQATSGYDSALHANLFPKSTKSEEDLHVFFYNESCKQIVSSELSNVLYLGPFRQSPLRRYPTRGSSPTEVGAQGENAITLLANEFVQTKRRPHLKEIGGWLDQMGLAKKVDVSRVGKSDLFDVTVTLADDANLPIADLGYGMSQVLPVLVQCSFAPDKATLLFEQPELHLNHTAAKLLAGVFVETAKKKEMHIVAETHSRELFLGLLDEIRANRLSPENLAVYTVKRSGGSSKFKKIEIDVDENGVLDVYDPWDSEL